MSHGTTLNRKNSLDGNPPDQSVKQIQPPLKENKSIADVPDKRQMLPAVETPSVPNLPAVVKDDETLSPPAAETPASPGPEST